MTDGTGLTRITFNSFEDEDPFWSPDGTKIAFDSDRDGNDEIYVMNTDGSAPTNRTNHFAGDYEAAFSPDSQELVFYSDRER